MLQILNPADATLVSELAEDTPSTIREKAESARGAQADWAATPLTERCRCITRFRQLLIDRQDARARTLTQEMGKPIRQSANEIKGTLARIDLFLQHVYGVTERASVCPEPNVRA